MKLKVSRPQIPSIRNIIWRKIFLVSNTYMWCHIMNCKLWVFILSFLSAERIYIKDGITSHYLELRRNSPHLTFFSSNAFINHRLSYDINTGPTYPLYLWISHTQWIASCTKPLQFVCSLYLSLPTPWALRFQFLDMTCNIYSLCGNRLFSQDNILCGCSLLSK